jgi:hypothetical protein
MKTMQQHWSRRGLLTLAGGGLAGAAVLSTSGSAQAGTQIESRVANERAYRALSLPSTGTARIQQTQGGGTSGAQVDAALDSRSIRASQELVVSVQVSLASDLVGRRRVLRAFMIGDNGDLRMETVGPDTRIDDASFELEIALGRGDPIRDWNLISERIFALRVSLDVLDTDDFAVSDDFLFKVRRA